MIFFENYLKPKAVNHAEFAYNEYLPEGMLKGEWLQTKDEDGQYYIEWRYVSLLDTLVGGGEQNDKMDEVWEEYCGYAEEAYEDEYGVAPDTSSEEWYDYRDRFFEEMSAYCTAIIEMSVHDDEDIYATLKIKCTVDYNEQFEQELLECRLTAETIEKAEDLEELALDFIGFFEDQLYTCDYNKLTEITY